MRVNITSEHDAKGFKSAEDSAKVLERELNKLEQQQRRQVQMQMQAAREMAAAEAEKAAAIVEANRRQSDAMQSAGKVLLGVSGAIAVGLGLSAKAAIGWESAWAGVRKTVDGSPEELAALEGQLRTLVRSLPATHQEIAAVAEAAGQLGVKRQDVASFTKTMIDLGETTNLSSDEAATSLAQLSNIMGIGAGQASQLGSALVELGNNGASTERDIVSMGLRIAGAGRTVGLTAPQVLGMASALSSVGIEAEAGGTAISRVMLQIDKDVASGAGSLEGYARIAGTTADDFARKWKTAPAEAITAFVAGLGRMQAEGKNTTQALDDLGFSEVRVSDTLRRASLAGDLLTTSLQMGSKAFDENIALVDEANKRYETTEARLQVARNEINDAAIDIGGNLLPALSAGADGVADLAAGFGTLSPEMQRTVTGLGVAVGGLTGLVGVASIAIPRLTELSATITNLRGGSSLLGRALGGAATILTGPWGLAIAAATIGIGVWLQKQGEARRRVDELTASIDQNTGAWSNLSREITYRSLKDAGVIDDAKAAGLELSKVLDAALGSTDAYRQLEAQVNATYDRMAKSPNGPDPVFAQAASRTLEGLRDRSAEAAKAQEDYALRVEAGAVATDDATSSTTALNTALDQTGPSAQDAAEGIDDLTKAVADADGEFINLLGGYNAIIEKNKETAQSTADSTKSSKDSWQDYYDGFSVSLDKYLAELESQVAAQQAWEQNMLLLSGRVSAGVLDELSKLGPEGAPLVADLVNASDEELARLEAVYGQRSADATVRFAETLRAAGPVLAEIMGKAGTDAAAEAAAKLASGEATLQQVIDQYDLAFTVDADTNRARAEIEAVLSRYQGAKIQLVASVNTANIRPGQIGITEANGGVVEYYAAGGLREHHVAQIAPAGAWRVWAEPETGGEGYVPLAQAKRDQSENVMSDIADRFGGIYVRGAEAAALAARATAPSAPGITPEALAGAMRAALAGVVWEVDGTPLRAMARDQATSVVRSARSWGGAR